MAESGLAGKNLRRDFLSLTPQALLLLILDNRCHDLETVLYPVKELMWINSLLRFLYVLFLPQCPHGQKY